jgi:hypothetical protein
MKNYHTVMTALFLTANTVHAETAVTKESAWEEIYAVETASPRLVIGNIWGGIRVRPGKAGEIAVSVMESRSAPDRDLFEYSLQVLGLEIETNAGSVSMQVGQTANIHRSRNGCNGCRVDYQFDILVPSGTVVDVSTVMGGRIDIEGITGAISASNVNGAIRMNNIQECDSINSVNGKVVLGFLRAPIRDCRIETINGDINLDMPADSGLDVTLDLFNGKTFSALPTVAFAVPGTVKHTVENGRNQYHIEKLSGLRVGIGGPTYAISSLNGDVRIRKNQ